MNRRLLLLRGVNVGGNKKVPMADLRELLLRLDCRDVVTHLNSGNAVVTTGEADPDALGTAVETAIAESFGFDVCVLVRTPDELAGTLSSFASYVHGRDQSRTLVTFLRGRGDQVGFDSALQTGVEPCQFWLDGRELLGWYPEGVAKAPLTLPQWERALGTIGTARNWRTVTRLRELLGM